MKNKMMAVIIGVVVVGTGSFYAGMKYGAIASSGQVLLQNGQARFPQMGVGGGRGARTNGVNGGGFANGEVISKDEKSITIKLRDNRQSSSAQDGQGGSKIVFFSDSTQIMKTVDGSSKDISIGEQVMATGSANPDGSISAQAIQIRPTAPSNGQQQ